MSSRAYKPNDSSLVFAGALCEPGDYSGKHTNTEAKVDCIFEKPVTTKIFSKVGAKLASD